MFYYIYVSEAGQPKTGLTPTWLSLRTAENAADRSAQAPAIDEIGGGWYRFDITYGQEPWDIKTEDLVGVIDNGNTMIGLDRYKPIVISLRGLALARIAHKAQQNKADGHVTLYQTDGVNPEMQLTMSETTVSLTRQPDAAESV